MAVLASNPDAQHFAEVAEYNLTGKIRLVAGDSLISLLAY